MRDHDRAEVVRITGAESLFTRTAQLPQVALQRPARAIGKNTINSIQAGLVFGYAGMVEGVVGRMKAELGGAAHVVATGGLAELIAGKLNLELASPARGRLARQEAPEAALPLLLAAEVVVAREIGSGVVPIDAGERAWRERHGRLLRQLAEQAGHVYRIFCGLTEELK